MKKCFVLSMVLCMMLCGCSFENTSGTDATDAAKTTEAAQDTTAAEPTTEKVTEAATEAVTEPQRSWQEIYAEVIREQQAAAEELDEMKYDLIYIDADNVPELYVSQGIEYKGVYTILNDTAAELHPMTYYQDAGFDSYAERQGVYYTSSDGGAGHGSIEVWHVENGVAEMTDDYRFDVNPTGDDTDYFLNDVSILKGEFDAALAKKTAESQRASGVSFAEIMKEIGYTTETWQEQYGWIIEEANAAEEPDMIRYALFYLNNDSIPELCIYDKTSTAGTIYQSLAGQINVIDSWENYENEGLVGYREKSGIFYTSTLDKYSNMPCATVGEWLFKKGIVDLQNYVDLGQNRTIAKR